MRDLDKRVLGQKIRRLRTIRGMTQKELAKAIGVGESTLCGYELGNRYPKEKHLEAIARALKVRPETFRASGIDNRLELMHELLNLEDKFGLRPEFGRPSLGATPGSVMEKFFRDWGQRRRMLMRHEITEDEYEEWKATYNPEILFDCIGTELPDPYTGKMLQGKERDGAIKVVEIHPSLLVDR